MLKAILSISLKASSTFQTEENLYLQMKSTGDETIFCKILCTGIAGEEESCRRAVIHLNRVFIIRKPVGSVTAAMVSIALFEILYFSYFHDAAFPH